MQDFSFTENRSLAAEFNFSDIGDNLIYPGIYEAAVLSSGWVSNCTDLVSRGTVAVDCNTAGGLHHTMLSYAFGFRVFNDPVISTGYLVSLGLRVAYVDIGANYGIAFSLFFTALTPS